MGISEIECVVVEMDEEKEKALNVALNKISGDWDRDKLALVISDLQGADFDVSLTGFDPAGATKTVQNSLRDGVHEDDFDVRGREKPAVTKPGISGCSAAPAGCGDSTKPETFKARMDSRVTSPLVVTDPPYNVNYEVLRGK